MNMLVNMMGIEQIDEIVDMSDRRTEATVDPKSRVTLTTLFGEVLASFQGAGLAPALTSATATAPIVGHDFMTRPAISEEVQSRRKRKRMMQAKMSPIKMASRTLVMLSRTSCD